jgi:hypothetical protein
MQYGQMLMAALVPVAWLVLQFITFHCALHTSNPRIRRFLFPFLICFTGFSFTASKAYFLVPGLTNLWAQSLILNFIHITSLLYIEKLPPPGPEHAPRSSIRATYGLWSNPQLIRNEQTADDEKDKEPLGAFLFLRLSKLPLYYYLDVYLLPMLFSETILELIPSDVAQPGLVTRFNDLTAREVVVRSYTAVCWVWKSLVFLDGINAALACLRVLASHEKPRDWPSLFGSPLQACGLRNFWSSFWHQLASRPYRNYGRVVCHCLGLQPKSLASKTVIAFTAFLLSGVSHQLVSWRLGNRDWLDVQWFMLNFLGCLGETLVLSLVRNLAKRTGCTRELQAIERSWFGYAVGYTWVFVFFFWSVPLWRWPRLHKELTAVERWMSILSDMTILPAN